MTKATTNPPHADPFFIGWRPIPPTYRRFLVPVIVCLLLIVGTTASAVAYLQRDPGNANWETENVRTFDGVVCARPYAMLRVPGDPPRTVLLVEDGKFGALARVEQILQGKRSQAVRVTGTLLQRDGRWMLELVEGENGMRKLTREEQRQLLALAWPEPQLIAESVTLAGEIIDPKCYLGAMKPGGGKTHKACAMLCVAGGVPPMLVTRDASGQETFYLLTDAEGGVANQQVLPFVGDAVTVTGRLERDTDLLVLRVAAGAIHRR